MKKTFLNAILFSIGGILLLTSCLGDSSNATTIDRAYAYIHLNELGTTKIAQVGGIPVSNDALKSSNLQSGDCTIIGFKINSNNVSSDGQYFIADYINIPTSEESIFRREDQTLPWLITVDTTYTAQEIYFDNLPTSVSTGMSDLVIYNAKEMGYRWFITYKYTKKKSEEEPKLRLYFDEEKQVNLSQVALKDDEIVIDFRLERQGTPITEGESKMETQTKVVNFTAMIQELEDNVAKGSSKTYYIKFRYFTKVDSPKDGQPAYKLAMTPNQVTSITIDKTSTDK